jgi:hypothetical protein
MKLKSIYEVRGVKVVSGKGKGTTRAQPGDIFECALELADRLLAEQVAIGVDDELPKDASMRGPEVTPEVDVSKSEEPSTKPTLKSVSKKTKSPAQSGTLGDLGLGDGSSDE